LKALGYEEGKNLHLDFRNLTDEEAARATAQEFVRERVHLLVAFENPSVRAAKALGLTIPQSVLPPGGRADPIAKAPGAPD
jgi:hypothetical protein